MKKLLALVVVGFVLFPQGVFAKKMEKETNNREVVVHSNRAPVVVHRIFPPYGLHKHVYAGNEK